MVISDMGEVVFDPTHQMATRILKFHEHYDVALDTVRGSRSIATPEAFRCNLEKWNMIFREVDQFVDVNDCLHEHIVVIVGPKKD